MGSCPLVAKMTAPGQPQTGPLPESPENTERRALWRTGLGQLPTGSFYLGTRHSPSLQCRLLRGRGPPFWDLNSAAWDPHILTLTVGVMLRDVPFSLTPTFPHHHLEGTRGPNGQRGRGAFCTKIRRRERGGVLGYWVASLGNRSVIGRPTPTSVPGTLTEEASHPQEIGGSTRALAPN